uniref:Chorismate lyase n=1 Tax=Digenea simplex TaxID=945030 RepID=A0A1Z1MTR1_DIGSM|nr:hypothetical protein [Digenea simplex]ARW69478.1 hypothetical protein [Digenea simplex]
MNYLVRKLPELNESKLKFMLINDGSLTKAIQYINNKKVHINSIQKRYTNNYTTERIIRYVWLETCTYTKLIFARSLWILIYNKSPYMQISLNEPIGLSFIQHKIDICKTIHEIYYGYSNQLEETIKSQQPIWGRKYTLYYRNRGYITIQEFFSPKITNLFI